MRIGLDDGHPILSQAVALSSSLGSDHDDDLLVVVEQTR
jgi:hypothetical protein